MKHQILYILLVLFGFAEAQNHTFSFQTSSTADVQKLINLKIKKGTIAKKQPEKESLMLFNPLPLDKSQPQPFVAVVPYLSVETNTVKHDFFIRTITDGVLSAWIQLYEDHHTAEHIQASEMYQIDFTADSFQLMLKIHTDESVIPARAFVNVFYPGYTPKNSLTEFSRPKSGVDCECDMPPYLDRLGWCPVPFNCPAQTNPTFTTVTHMVVHHSAGANTSTDWSATVRAIWNFHVNTNNWSDIGYNYLIDPTGVIYEGRGNNVIGAHFSGMNARTMGVCLLGNFQTATPTQAALDALTQLLGWKSCDIGASPTSSAIFTGNNTNLNVICGHRDSNNPPTTLCPGDNMYPLLPAVRNNTEAYIENCELVEEPTPQNSDIVVISMNSTPQNPVAGEQTVLNVRLRNIGAAAITQPFGTSFRINGTVVSNVSTASLNSSAFVDLTTNYVFPQQGTYQYCVFAETAHNEINGLNNSFCVQISVAAPKEEEEDTTTVSVNNIVANSILIYPNPVGEVLYIESDFSFEKLVLYNALGQALMESHFSPKQAINVNSLPQGVYVLKLIADEATAERKILIER